MLIKKLRSRDLLGRRRKNDKGFTLVELLVVITILGILAAVVIAAVSGIGDKGEEAATDTDASIQATAQEANCTVNGQFDDPLIVQRNGFLANAAGKTDVELDRSVASENCNGTSATIWRPEKTSYPVTIAGCLGNLSTFTKKPSKPMALTQSMHELFAHLGLTGDLKVPYPQGDTLRPLHLRDQMGPDLAANPGVNTAADPRGYADADYVDNGNPRHILKLSGTPGAMINQDVDFVTADRPAWFLNVPEAGSTRADYTEQNIRDAFAPTLGPGDEFNTYAGFAHGGCSRVLDRNWQGEGVPRTSIEGILRDIRNIGIIFDVQERAADVIADLKERAGASLNKAGAGAGMTVAYVNMAGSDIWASMGDHGTAGYINVAGGKNVFADQFATIGRRAINAQELVDAAPQVLVIHGGTTTTPTDVVCTDAVKNVWRSHADLVGRGIPAIDNDRIVCGGGQMNNHTITGAWSLIDRIASELALGRAHRGPGAV